MEFYYLVYSSIGDTMFMTHAVTIQLETCLVAAQI